jgi:hypothetical protein
MTRTPKNILQLEYAPPALSGDFVYVVRGRADRRLTVGDISGFLPGNNLDLQGMLLLAYSVQEVEETVSGVYEADMLAATVFVLTVEGDVSITFTNAPVSPAISSATFILIQSNGGGHSVTFPGAKWDGGIVPNLAFADGQETDLSFVVRDGGLDIRGYIAAEDMR